MNGKKQNNLENQKHTRTHKNHMAATMRGKRMVAGTTTLTLQETELKKNQCILYMKKLRRNQIL
eukprot:2159722-Prorocentrum_lima.AAC.1